MRRIFLFCKRSNMLLPDGVGVGLAPPKGHYFSIGISRKLHPQNGIQIAGNDRMYQTNAKSERTKANLH